MNIVVRKILGTARQWGNRRCSTGIRTR